MCTAWIIDGKRVETGQELVDAIGLERATYVNEPYDNWLECCLCHVDGPRMTETFGGEWRYDFELDAMTPSEPER